MNFKSILLLFSALIILFSCTDDNGIGGTIRPPKDKVDVSFVDSISFSAFSFIPDSMRTDGGISGYNYFMLGGFKPQGIEQATSVKADIAMEFWFDELEMVDGGTDSTLVLDSVILLLIQNGFYGDSMATNLIEVYELDERLSNSVDYYSNEDPLDYYSPENKIGELQVQPNDYSIPDTVRFDEDYLRIISVPLNKSVGQRIIDNLGNIENVEDFRNLFKGVYVKTEIGEGALLNIFPYLTREIVTDFSAINVVYHYESGDESADPELMYSQSLICNNQCARFNVLRKTKGTYDFNVDENTIQPSLLYAQGLGISSIRLKFPSLADHPEFQPDNDQDSVRIAINNAKLTFEIDRELQDVEEFRPPNRLLIRRDTSGGRTFIPDEVVYISSGESYNGGLLDIETYTYEFNISEYVQEIIDSGTDDPDDLILSVSQNRNNPGFAFLKGLTSDDKVKFEIVYTRY